jgi:hypothetical protein
MATAARPGAEAATEAPAPSYRLKEKTKKRPTITFSYSSDEDDEVLVTSVRNGAQVVMGNNKELAENQGLEKSNVETVSP